MDKEALLVVSVCVCVFFFFKLARVGFRDDYLFYVYGLKYRSEREI